MGNNDLQTYILKEKGKKERYSLDEWKKSYGQYLRALKVLPQNPYNDPDAKETKNQWFYDGLKDFLNAREQEYYMKKRDAEWEKWTYSTRRDEKLGYVLDVSCNDKIIMSLKSDQFGFSAPRPEKDHPYDIYLETCSEEDIDRISEWIYYSRTIGGSFLWPTNMMKGSHYANYNTARGGSNPFENGKYKGRQYNNYPIEDRVDLTLLEIFLYYHKEEYPDKWKKTILNKWFKKNEGANKKIANQWFGHFGSFEKYVDFFCFNDFVHEDKNNNEKKYEPIDIVKSNLNKSKKKDNKVTIDEDYYYYNSRKNRSDFSIYDKGHKDMETMFNNVNILITRRTKTMEKK